MSSPPGSAPPPPNPVLSAYEQFVIDTPLVTRYALQTLTLSWFVSWFANPGFALANVPLFTLMKFELYRIVLAPLVCSSLLSLIFAYLSFRDNGSRLERSMGSGAFVWLLLTLGVVTNLAHLALCCLLTAMTGSRTFLILPSSGVWTVLLGLIATECARAPRNTQRKLFVVAVPTIYYPLALLALFSLFGGFQIPYCLSVAVGYAHGYGKLERFRVSETRVNRWESNEGCLSNFTSRQGWIVGRNAEGGNAWGNEQYHQGGDGGGGGWSPQAFFQGNRASTDGSSSSTGPSAGGGGPGAVSAPPEPVKPAFPSGSKGRTLGGSGGASSRRPKTSEERAALLEAAERRLQQQGEGSGGGGGDEEV